MPGGDNPPFIQREMGLTHTSYMEETLFLSLIQQGNVGLVKQALKNQISSGIVIGRLSKNQIRQMKYWAVCCITLSTRYAIQGVLDDMLAFNLSDRVILTIDEMTNPQTITAYLEKMVVELTELVQKSHCKDYPVAILCCINYINKHLHEKITLSQLAALVGLSPDYLSKIFKNQVGKTISAYIMEKKLEAAKAMLLSNYEQKMVAYDLGFCSQTYFISCFKKFYGITPHKFALMGKNETFPVEMQKI